MNPTEPTQPNTPPETPAAPPAPVEAPTSTPEASSAPVAQQTATPAAPSAVDPGKTLGLAGFIVSLLSAFINVFTFGIPAIIALVLSILGLNKSKKAGHKNGLALAGVIISAIVIVLTLVFFVVAGLGFAALLSKCAELGPGVHYVDGVEITCNQ